MIRCFLLGSAASLLIAGPVSALTMTPNADARSVQAHAIAGADDDFDADSPNAPLAIFGSSVNAEAMEFGPPPLTAGDAEYELFGASSYASAFQDSSVGPLSISGSGSAEASGDHGGMTQIPYPGDSDSFNSHGGHFQAYGKSVLEIVFSIDEAAAFDLSGFLGAGTELAVGADSNDVINRASISLFNTATLESAFKAEISDDFLEVDEMGVIVAGEYRFKVEAYAEVFGGALIEATQLLGDADDQVPFGYQTSAGFKGVLLELSATDQPIPEPVTTTLAGLGLGALALQTTRRRRA